MALTIIDIVTSIIQSIAFTYTISSCVDKEDKINKIKLFIMTLLFFLSSQILTGPFGGNSELSIFLSHALAIILIVIFYRRSILEALAAFTISYLIFSIYTIMARNLILRYIRMIFPEGNDIYITILAVYFPLCIFLIIYFKYINRVKQVYKLIIYERLLNILLMVSLLLDFILTSYLPDLIYKSQLVKNMIYMLLFVLFIAVLVYFLKIHQKSEHILKLNQALEIKNNELRKIKHDYGAQISYLYGLCLMKRFEDLKKSLKDIINNNESTSTAVEVSSGEKSILSMASKPAIDRGIHVIIEENCDLTMVNMNQKEFYRVVSNIISNAIIAMDGKGIIIAKSYEYLGSIVIKIKNNGPKIPKMDLNRIFEVGFTTKENSDSNHGYGLSIAKDLVESYNGKIYVKSTEAATEFKIVLPVVQKP